MQRQHVEALLKLVPSDVKDEHENHKWGFFHFDKRPEKALPLLQESKYLAFWKELKKPVSATFYVEMLLRKVAELEMLVDPRAGAARRSGSGRRSWTYGLRYRTPEGKLVSPGCPQLTRNFAVPPPQASPEIKDSGTIALLNTILLLSMYEDVDLTKYSIVAAVDETPDELHTAGESWRHAVAHLLKLLRVSRRKHLSAIISIFAAFMSSSMAALDNSMIGGGWIYLWLQDHALHGRARKIHRGLLISLEPITSETTNVITPAHELQVMCLLFVLRQALSLTLVPDEPLKKLEEQVYRLTFWPDPVGHHASETLESILLEKKAPGHAIRKRCWLNDSRLSAQVGRGLQERARVPVLLNPSCPRSSALQCLLDCERAGNLSRQEDAKRLQLLKILLVHQMLIASGVAKLVQQAEAGSDSFVCKLSEATLSKLYSDLLKLEEEASQMRELDAAMEHRSKRVLEIWNEIQHQQKEEHESFQLPDSSQEMIAASLLPLEFSIFRTEPVWMPKPVETEQPAVQTCYPTSAAEDSIRFVMESSNSDLVRLLVAGGDGSIHYFLLGYLNLVSEGVVSGGLTNPEMVRDLLFFILPTGESSNCLASYIAHQDLWYDGTIFRPVKSSLPLVPHVGELDPKLVNQHLQASTGSTSTSRSSEKRSDIIPSLMLTRQIENFMLEASCVLNVKVFNCEAWFRDSKGKRFMTTIPFCTRAEIGVPVVSISKISHEQKKVPNYQCYPRSPGKEPLEQDKFEDLASSFSIKLRLVYRPVDWDGREMSLLHDQQIPVTALLAINVPRAYESRLNCNPSDELLNVCVMDSEGAKKQKLRTMEQVSNRASTFKTSKLVVQSADPSKSFEILLDGEVYGPLLGVRFVPAAHPHNGDAGVSFPVATFWPTHISRR